MGKTPMVKIITKISRLLKLISLIDNAKYKDLIKELLILLPEIKKKLYLLLISYLLNLNILNL